MIKYVISQLSLATMFVLWETLDMGRKAKAKTRQIGWRINIRLLDEFEARVDAAALDRRKIAESIIAWWLVCGVDQQADLNATREAVLRKQAEDEKARGAEWADDDAPVAARARPQEKHRTPKTKAS